MSEEDLSSFDPRVSLGNVAVRYRKCRTPLCPICVLALTHIRTYNGLMKYEWDQEKAEANLQRHNVDFADAVSVLEDDAALTLEDQYPYEERFVTVGMDALGRVLVVIYTWRGELIRLISARKATPRERGQYEGKHR
jgi:uncharacterized protein